MRLKCHCDNPEGNLCPACEEEIKQVEMEIASDGWWPRLMTPRRSINVASSTNEQPKDMLYV